MKSLLITTLIILFSALTGYAKSPKLVIVKVAHICSDSSKHKFHEFEEACNEAVNALNNNDYTEASRKINLAITKATQVHANLDTLYYLRAQILAENGYYNDAINVISKMQVCVGNFSIYNSGIYALKCGLFEKAISSFTDQLNNSSVLAHECHWGIGYAFLNAKEYNEAEVEFNKALKIHENENVRLGLVEIFMRRNQRAAAIRELKIVVLKNPGNKIARFYLANLLLNEGQLNEIANFYSYFILDNTYEATITKANLLYKAGNFISAIDYYKKAIKIKKVGNEAKIGLANVYLAQNKKIKAKKLYNEILANDATNQFALEGMGIINYLDGDEISALSNLMKAHNYQNGYQLSYTGLLYAGSILLQYNLLKDAEDFFTRAIKCSKNNSWAHAGLGLCMVNQKNFLYNNKLIKKAKSEFRLALRSNPNDTTLLAYIGIAEYASNDFESAIKHISRAIDKGSKNETAYNTLALAYSKVEQFEKAREIITKVRELAPTNPEYWINSGVIECAYASYLIKKDKTANIDAVIKLMNKYYDAALAHNADSSIIKINKGVGYTMVNFLDTALTIYSSITKCDSMVLAAVPNNIGVVNAMRGNDLEAKSYFENGNSIDVRDYLTEIDANISKINRSKFSSTHLKKIQFTSINFYYLPSIPFIPQFKNELNVPLTNASMLAPNELQEVFKYNYHCDQKYTRTIKITKNPGHEKVRLSKVDACAHM